MTLDVREVPWGHPDATELRRGMWEHYRPKFPEETARAEATYGGFEGVDAYVGRNIVATVLVSDGGSPVGVGSLRPVPRLGPTVGEVKKVYVAAEARSRGVARAVMAELERLAVGRGWDRLVLETDLANDAAVGLYASLGYETSEPLRSAGPVSMAKNLGAETGAPPGPAGPVSVADR